jgi:iron complex outermembrane receptor protein
MKKQCIPDGRRHLARQKYTPIALACATLALPAAEVLAQAAAPSQTVVVTGIRRAIETSIAVKRNSDQIVEAISAEDIGKLPDNSIAESLARLPGLTAQRVDGRDQVITIRGMAPKFAVTLLNGRQLVSTGDNRSVEYDQFPSELMNGATVYKTPDATLSGQGLAGTVDLGTVKPLDRRGRHLSFNARMETNSNGALVSGSDDKGSRLSFAYIDQFADNTLGVALGYARLNSPRQQKYFKSWWWANSAVWGGAFTGLENPDPKQHPHVLQGFDTGVVSTDSTRDGAMAVFEYKPNKDFHSQLDLYYSKFDQKARGREFQANLPPSWSGDGTKPITSGPAYSNMSYTTLGNDRYVTGGTLTNVDPYVLMRHNQRKDTVTAIGWNNELTLGAWKAVADVSLSKAERDEEVAELTASATAKTGFSKFYAETGSGFSKFTPQLNYGSGSVVQLRGIMDWGNLNGAPSAGSFSPIKVDDEMKALRLSAKRSLAAGFLSSVEGGLHYNNRSKDTVRTQTIFALKNGVSCLGGRDTCAPIPTGILQTPTDLSFSGNPSLVSFDFNDAVNSGVYNSGPINQSSAPGRIWGVDEKVTTLFGKAGLDFELGVPIRGNFGLQMVRAQQTSTGILWDGAARNMKSSTSYTDVLPSLNLNAELGSGMYARLGVAKTLARPNLEDMRAGYTASVATSGANLGKWSGSGGNPDLEPWRATSYDLSFEKYFAKRSYFAVAGWYKQVATSIYIDTIPNFDFTGFPNNSGITPINNNRGTMNTPVNGQGGKIQGLELSTSLEGALVSEALDGFGVQASFSETSSDLPGTANNGRKDPNRKLEGLSGQVWSVAAYYEKNGWQIRAAQRYRSKFVAAVRGVWIDNSLAAIEAEKISDLQLGYSFETGSLKGLSVVFSVNNVFDTPYRTSSGDETSNPPNRLVPERYYTYGRQYLLGVNYKM